MKRNTAEIGHPCDSALDILRKAAKLLVPYETAETRSLLLEIESFPQNLAYITEDEFEQAYQRRFALRAITPNNAVQKAWLIKQLVADFVEQQARDFEALKTFSNLFTLPENAQFLNDNILRRVPHYSLSGRFQVVCVENSRLKTLLTNMGSFACYSEFCGFVHVSSAVLLLVGVVSCQRQWRRYGEESPCETPQEVLRQALSSSIAEGDEVFQQIKAAVNGCSFEGRELLGEALKTLVDQGGCMERQILRAKSVLDRLLQTYEIPRFKEALTAMDTIGLQETQFVQVMALQQVVQRITSYLRNSSLEQIGKGQPPLDMRADFRSHLYASGVSIVPHGPQDLYRRACFLVGDPRD